MEDETQSITPIHYQNIGS